MCWTDDLPKYNSRVCQANSQRALRARSGVCGDPVRLLRVRGFIERCVVAALGLSGRPQVGLQLAARNRGGAALAFARQVSMYLAHVGCGLNFTQTAALYGRDRKTAAHACAVVEDTRDNPVFDRAIELLEGVVRLGIVQIEPDLAGPFRRP